MTLFSDGFVETPYWWEAAAPEEGRPHGELRDVDFLVVGAGLTALAAARAWIEGERRIDPGSANPFGDGRAARRIRQDVADFLDLPDKAP